MTAKPWHEVSSKPVLATPWFTITKHNMIDPNGQPAEYFVHNAPDSVLAVCVTQDGKVLVEDQYRPPVGRISTDFVAGGMLPEDADPQAAMIREIREETGYEVVKVELMASLYSNPGFSSGRAHLFLVQVGARHHRNLDPTESILLHALTPKEIAQHVAGGRIACVFCVTATHLAFAKMGWSSLLK